MERAGLAVFQAIQQMLPSGHLVVMCGKGNNGGDGFVVARLAKEAGYRVDCLVAAEERDLSPDAADQLTVARAQGVDPIFFADARWTRKADCMAGADLIVDALLGTGTRGMIEGPPAEAIHAINHSGVPVISVDIPSGIHCDTGEELGESVWALRTVTMGLPKPFLFQGTGLEHCGYWSVADIGFPSALLSEPHDAMLIERGWVIDLLPERLRGSHKGTNGHLLIVAGSSDMLGAATLTAKAAFRCGVGLVTVACIPEVKRAVAANVPEATFLTLPESGGTIAREAAALLLEHQARFDAAVFGPGLTHSPEVMAMLGDVWGHWTKPCVVDADALNAVSQGIPMPNAPVVMTPHAGEMSRLLKLSVAEVQADRFRAVRRAGSLYGHTIVLKGPYSIIGTAESPMIVNNTGNPGMASGGMGDVLSGVIGTLLAQELMPREAAAAGAYWHGAAGDVAAQEVGLAGFTSMDVAERLPTARMRIVEPANDCRR